MKKYVFFDDANDTGGALVVVALVNEIEKTVFEPGGQSGPEDAVIQGVGGACHFDDGQHDVDHDKLSK